jgi:membrane protease YdiL (CAAX protease family)
MSTTMNEPLPRPPWLVPLGIALTAIPTFVAFWIGGNPALGAAWAGVSLVLAVIVAAGGRSETIRLVRGEQDDERAVALESQALTITSMVLTVALVGLFLVSGIRGGSGLVYGLLLLLAEGTHLAALAVLNRRG